MSIDSLPDSKRFARPEPSDSPKTARALKDIMTGTTESSDGGDADNPKSEGTEPNYITPLTNPLTPVQVTSDDLAPENALDFE